MGTLNFHSLIQGFYDVVVHLDKLSCATFATLKAMLHFINRRRNEIVTVIMNTLLHDFRYYAKKRNWPIILHTVFIDRLKNWIDMLVSISAASFPVVKND